MNILAAFTVSNDLICLKLDRLNLIVFVIFFIENSTCGRASDNWMTKKYYSKLSKLIYLDTIPMVEKTVNSLCVKNSSKLKKKKP